MRKTHSLVTPSHCDSSAKLLFFYVIKRSRRECVWKWVIVRLLRWKAFDWQCKKRWLRTHELQNLCFKTQLYVHLGTQTVISSIWIQVICCVWRGILHKYVYCVTVEWALFLIVNVEYISYPFPMLRPVFFTKQAAGVKQTFCFGALSINHQIARQVMSLWYDFPSQCLLLFLRRYIS